MPSIHEQTRGSQNCMFKVNKVEMIWHVLYSCACLVVLGWCDCPNHLINLCGIFWYKHKNRCKSDVRGSRLRFELQLNGIYSTWLLNIMVKHLKRTALKEFLEHHSNYNHSLLNVIWANLSVCLWIAQKAVFWKLAGVDICCQYGGIFSSHPR